MGEAEKCPICGDEISFGECSSCGFVPPDYSVIAAPYDLDPSNDRFGETDPAEGMFPADMPDMEGVSPAEMPELEIPSIALPNMQSLGSLGFASANAKPAPKIVVMRSNPLPGASQPFPKQTNPNAASGRQPVQPQTVQAVRTAQSAQSTQHTQAAPFVPYVQQASLTEQFVKGVVNFVISNWWKALIVALAPTAGIFFALYFFSKFKEDHFTCDILMAVIFGVISVVLIFNGWDPIGLDEMLQTVMSYFSDDYY